MAKALIPMTDGFEDIEAVTVIDILRRGGVEVVTAAIGESVEVKSAHGISMKADALLPDAAEADYDAIVLPGGPGTPALGRCQLLVERLRRQKEEGKLLCAICAAPVVLCENGLVDPDLHVTCYPTCVMDLDRNCAGAPVVADANVITGQAPGSAMLFALVVLQALAGETVAKKVARGLVTDVLDEPDLGGMPEFG